jgi:hypothetical protein
LVGHYVEIGVQTRVLPFIHFKNGNYSH